MKSLLIKLVSSVKRLIMTIIMLSGFLWGGYSYLKSDIGLLSDETLIAIISDDVLGDPTYGKSCPRSSYNSEVESHLGGDKSSGYFVFNPSKGQESNCPPIAIIANRKTAEAWIADRQ